MPTFSPKSSERRVIVQLMGGLGNQMFQYAVGRMLAKRQDAELVLDTRSGFVRDRVYNRHYELDCFPIKARRAGPLERFPFWFDRILAKFRLGARPKSLLRRSIIGRHRIHETELRFLPELVKTTIPTPFWVTGYWQSPKYFAGLEMDLVAELSPPLPKQNHFLKMGDRIRSNPSVAVGIRLYEESPNPGAQSKKGALKNAELVNRAIAQLASLAPNVHFYIFCTHRAKELACLRFPSAPGFVTNDDGFIGTVETLWLLTQCSHHIFTNSTFYWWGAWLSEHASPEEKHLIWAADDFINDDCLSSQWQRF